MGAGKSKFGSKRRRLCDVEGEGVETKYVKRRRREPSVNSQQDKEQQQGDQGSKGTTTAVKRSSRFRGISSWGSISDIRSYHHGTIEFDFETLSMFNTSTFDYAIILDYNMHGNKEVCCWKGELDEDEVHSLMSRQKELVKVLGPALESLVLHCSRSIQHPNYYLVTELFDETCPKWYDRNLPEFVVDVLNVA